MTSESNQDEVLTVESLAKTFRVGFWRERVEAVREVSFDVEECEIFGLVGPNGAGKTTTMKMMTGLIFPTEGHVDLFGEPVQNTDGRRRLGYLPEEPYFYGHLTAPELIRFYGSLHGMSRGEVNAKLDALLELVGLEDARRRPLREFSKGMRQRAGIAQALVNDPDLVVLDEPQSGLDPIGRREVRDLIFRLREEGKTVVFSSHILVDVEAVCDRVAILKDGKLVEIADLQELNAPKNQVVTAAFTGVNPEEVRELDLVEKVDVSGVHPIAETRGTADLADLVRRLDDLGAEIVSIDRRSGRLEEHFIEETDAPADPVEPNP